MHRVIGTIVIIAVVAVWLAVPAQAAPLVSWWEFDGNADDHTGSHHGTVIDGGGAAPGYTTGWDGVGQAISLDGANDYVSIPSLTGAMPQFSVAWWLHPLSRANYDNQIVAAGGWSQFVFHTTTDGGVYVGVVNPDWGSRFTPSQLGANTVELNEWQHFAFTYDNGAAKFYKNGQELASKTGMDTPAPWTGFRVGLPNANTIHGYADDVSVWNGPLTSGAVKALSDPNGQYAQQVLKDNPLAYWRLDEPGGATAHDLMGNHDGALSGAVTLGAAGALISDGANTAADFAGGSMRATVTGLRDNFSVEFWLNPDTHTNYNQSIGADGGWAQFNFHTGNNGEVWVGTGCCASDQRFGSGDLAAGTVELDKWQHFVFTFQETDPTHGLARFYKDARLLAERELLKGAVWTGFNIKSNVDGGVDEMAIYDYALTPGDVRRHYEASLPEPTTLALLGLGGLALLRRRRRRR